MSTQNIGNLKVSIGADTANLSRGIGRAKALIGGLASAAKVSGAAVGVAFAAAYAGMIVMAKGGLAAVDAQAKLARSVDGSIDGIRSLQIAGRDAGVELDLVNDAAREFGKALAEASIMGTGPAAEALDLLGLSAEYLMSLDVDERFAVMAERISDMGLSAQRAAFMMNEFGVSNVEAVALITRGAGAIRAGRAEVEKFGLSMSDDMAAGVESANQALSRIGYLFEGVRNQIAVGLAPVLQGLAINFQEASVAGGPLQGAVAMLVSAFTDLALAILDPAFIEAATLFGVTIARAIAGVARFMVVLADNADIAGVAMVALGAAMLFFSGPIGLAIAAVAGGVFLLSTRFGQSQTAAELAGQAYDDLQAALAVVDRSNEAAVASGQRLIETHIDQGRAALEAAKAELALARSKQQAGMALLSQNPLTADDDAPGGYAAAMAENTAAAAAQLDLAETQLERYQKTLEGFKRSSFPSQGTGAHPGAQSDPSGSGGSSGPQGLDALTGKLDKLITAIDPAKARLDQLTAAQGLLKQALDAGAISQEEYNLRLSQVNEKFKEVPANATAAAAGVRALSKEAKKAEDAGDDVAKGWEAAFSNLINNIDSGTDALKAFALEAFKMLAINGISKILGGSSWFDGPLIGKNALGTDNWRGGLSWVGEKGPELVNLPMGAQVIPNNKLGGGGSGMSFTYAPSIDARGASLEAVQELDQRMRADAAQFNGKVQQAVIKAQSGRKL